jgi:hypothetical protein
MLLKLAIVIVENIRWHRARVCQRKCRLQEWLQKTMNRDSACKWKTYFDTINALGTKKSCTRYNNTTTPNKKLFIVHPMPRIASFDFDRGRSMCRMGGCRGFGDFRCGI